MLRENIILPSSQLVLNRDSDLGIKLSNEDCYNSLLVAGALTALSSISNYTTREGQKLTMRREPHSLNPKIPADRILLCFSQPVSISSVPSPEECSDQRDKGFSKRTMGCYIGFHMRSHALAGYGISGSSQTLFWDSPL